jgi:hypothetical protein
MMASAAHLLLLLLLLLLLYVLALSCSTAGIAGNFFSSMLHPRMFTQEVFSQ